MTVGCYGRGLFDYDNLMLRETGTSYEGSLGMDHEDTCTTFSVTNDTIVVSYDPHGPPVTLVPEGHPSVPLSHLPVLGSS